MREEGKRVEDCVEVLDGDTFRDCDGQTVRLLGIDTPERGEPLYRQAGDKLRELLPGHELSYRFGARRSDRYGRLLALVWADSLFVNAALLNLGLANTYFFSDDLADPLMMDSLCEAQKRARAAERGIWSIAPAPADRYFANPRTMRFHRPECSGLRRADTTTYLRFLSREEPLDSCYSPCRNCKP